ncbi:DNA repair protein RecO [Pseudonocardia sp. ICBG601]|uniref:DNA repair protein RecO n=1 Tax=Pseudonocardia sp. ICBG601 TaxID=2846759 RepID=UPI001CF62137|nr:DNA repair protein RecO [Pseudonocardia sp. ICBG601]
MAQLYRDTGIVLRVQKLGEADRIITMLTVSTARSGWSPRACARTRSRWGARLEPFNHVDVQCYTGRTLDVVTQAQTVDAFAPAIVADWSAYSCGCAILETADRLVSEEGEPSLRVYLLLLGATRALADGAREPALVLDAFLLRAMSHAGWAPSLSDCARCATPGPHRSFTVAGGGMVCPRCRPPGSVPPAPETVALLMALLHGDWDTADASGTPTRRRPAAWSRRTCSGTWSASCARCPWSTAAPGSGPPPSSRRVRRGPPRTAGRRCADTSGRAVRLVRSARCPIGLP